MLISLIKRGLAILVAAFALLGLSASPSTAAPWHQGTDPVNTGCAASASTIYSGSVAGMPYEIRYSPACGTNWVRIPGLYGGVYMVIRSDWGGGTVGGSQWGSGGFHWTPQVYAPGSTCITFYVQRLVSGDPNTGNVTLC